MLFPAALLWLAVPAGAAMPACVVKKGGRVREPASWEALLACQETQRDKFSQRERAPAELERFDEFQRAEARAYMERHQAVVEGKKEEAPAAPEPTSAPLEAPSAPPPEPRAQQEGLAELKALLERESPGGVNGITPGAAKAIVKFLSEQQGGMSPQMTSLLQAVEKDGVRLSNATMLKVKDAARQAKGAGLDLGIDPGVERDLLDRGMDPKPGDPEPDYDKHGVKPSS